MSKPVTQESFVDLIACPVCTLQISNGCAARSLRAVLAEHATPSEQSWEDFAQQVGEDLVRLGKWSLDRGDMHEYRHALAAIKAGNSEHCHGGARCHLDATPSDPPQNEHHPRCYQNTGTPDDLPDDLCDCRVLRMIDAAKIPAPASADTKGVRLTEDEREAIENNLRWHFDVVAEEGKDSAYASAGTQNAIRRFERILAARLRAATEGKGEAR